jgi:ribonuclease HI
MKLKNNVIHIFCDGSCLNNPGIGGVGIVFFYNGKEKTVSKNIGYCTNNIAELTAVKIALSKLKKKDKPVWIYTDSQYSINVLYNNYNYKKNVDLINETKSIISEFKKVKFIKVKGHSGHKFNEMTDKLAKMGANDESVQWNKIKKSTVSKVKHKKRIRKRRPTKEEYKKYLNSKHWKNVKERYNKSKLNKGCCIMCGRKNKLNLHHKTYKRFGKERLSDLVYLCSYCHTDIHEFLRENKNTRTNLWNAIKKYQKQNFVHKNNNTPKRSKFVEKEFKPKVILRKKNVEKLND